MKGSPLSIRLFLAVGLLLSGSLQALAADQWEEGGSGAVAILPEPRYPEGITGASLFCVEQQWGFLLRTDPGKIVTPGTAGTVTVGGELFAFAAKVQPGAVAATVPVTILERLKSANSMSVVIGEGRGRLGAVFSLRGSRRVIEAIAPRCSQVDMKGYVRVLMSEMSLAVVSAKELLAEELRLFREATGKQPVLAATFIEGLDPGRQLLFATICGSVNYYGDSGCNLSGFVFTADQPEWREVYNTEGVHLFRDPNGSNGGWPNLVTLAVVGGLEPTHWVWGGDRYMLRDQLISEEDVVDPDAEDAGEEGDGAQ